MKTVLLATYACHEMTL